MTTPTRGDLRRLFALLRQPTGPVYVLDIGGRRWVTDRYVMFDAALAGVDAAVRDLPDGAYAVLATKPPVPHDFEVKDINKIADAVRRKLNEFDRTPDYRRVTPSHWLLNATDGRLLRLMVRETDEGAHAVFADRDVFDAWLLRFDEEGGRAIIEQAEPGGPIRFRRYTSLDTIGYLMPAVVDEVPHFPLNTLGAEVGRVMDNASLYRAERYRLAWQSARRDRAELRELLRQAGRALKEYDLYAKLTAKLLELGEGHYPDDNGEEGA